MAAKDITVERVRELLNYDPGSGALTWRITRGNQSKVGAVAGTFDRLGYIRISLHNRQFLAHRIAWALAYSKWSTSDIDHINGDVADNRLLNLREVSHEVNLQNRRRPNINNGTGFLGVNLIKETGKYRARIVVNGQPKHLGVFPTPEEAHAAYVAAKRLLHEGCSI